MTATDQGRAGFIAAIIETPADDAPRLVYADWLDEHGESARAEFIRLQCEMMMRWLAGPCGPVPADSPWLLGDDKYQALCRRERALMDVGYEQGWNDFPAWLEEWWFRRGFVDEVRLTAADWLRHGPRLVREHPLTAVRLSGKRPEQEEVSLGGPFVSDYFTWVLSSGPDDRRPSALPRPIFDRLPHDGKGLAAARYADEKTAIEHLSAALLAWAKSTPC